MPLRFVRKGWLIAFILLIGLIGLICYFVSLRGPARPVSPSSARVVTNSTAHPSEDPVTTYHSDATGKEPKYLRLPTIGTQGFIQKVGIDQYRQVAVPTNIYLAGWFTSSVAPGEPGLSVIDGHLDGYRKPGIFANLEKLKIGDSFSVELANGVTRKFRVITVQSLPTTQAAASLFSQIPGITRQLNLITCGGIYQGTAGYDHRIIVTSRLIE